jgi:DNA topoisomerase-1
VTSAEPAAAAREAGLRYATDTAPGIRRVKARGRFRYLGPDGKAIADRRELARIRSLAVPPAYVDVWISPDPRGHLQATGRDARGRKQYRYHKRWREVRDENKFDRMLAFAKALPAIRTAVRRDLAKTGLPREKVLAAVVSLLEVTMIRVGNEEYARDNDSYGLTTMRDEHVRLRGERIRFRFKGKSGREHDVSIDDKRLAKIVRACRDLPGEELFQYVDEDGTSVPIASADVNAYIREIADDDFTAKDFRTWEATVTCALALAAARADTATDAKALVVAAVKSVAARLGNTPAVCKRSYIHPAVIDAFIENGALPIVETDVERTVVKLIERVVNRDEKTHLHTLLENSVRAATASRRAPPRAARRAAR